MERKSNSEFREELELRTKAFSVGVFKYLDALPKKTSSNIIAFQLGKSASSIGANYREATRAESREDFGHKLQIALKEAAESCYWIEILRELYPTHQTLQLLGEEASSLRNLLQVISKRVRQKQPKQPNNQTTQTIYL
jgi:four helix bundle protein